MNINVRRRRDTFIGMKGFRQEFPDDFPANTDETQQMDEIEAVLALIEQFGSDQTSGLGSMRFTYNTKGIARENLREILEDMETAAKTFAYRIAGIDLIFRVPHKITDGAMLALARSFAEHAVPYEDEFKKRLPATFLADLQKAITDFEESLTPPEAAAEAKVEATAQLDQAVRRGMIARRILMNIMKLKYKNNPSRYQAWLSASHLNRAEKKDTPNNQPPTT